MIAKNINQYSKFTESLQSLAGNTDISNKKSPPNRTGDRQKHTPMKMGRVGQTFYFNSSSALTTPARS
jgi:hypothetical protein